MFFFGNSAVFSCLFLSHSNSHSLMSPFGQSIQSIHLVHHVRQCLVAVLNSFLQGSSHLLAVPRKIHFLQRLKRTLQWSVSQLFECFLRVQFNRVRCSLTLLAILYLPCSTRSCVAFCCPGTLAWLMYDYVHSRECLNCPLIYILGHIS